MTWPAPSGAQRWVEDRHCRRCLVGQRTTPAEPCWSCGRPTRPGPVEPLATAWFWQTMQADR